MSTPTAPGQVPGELARSRYGRRAPLPRRRVLVLAGVVLLLVVAWFASIALRLANPAVSFQDIGYKVLSAGSAEVTFDVTFAGRVGDSARAVCTLNAQNELHTDVGLRDVTVGPASRRVVRVTATLPTSETATTVLVKQCILQ